MTVINPRGKKPEAGLPL